MAKQTFTLTDLRQMLKNMGALVASPIGRGLIIKHTEAAIRRSKIGGALLQKVTLMYDYFRDPAEAVKPKILIGAALLYLIIPNDLIPDWVPLVGLTDDFAAIAIVWREMKDVLLHYDERRKERVLAQEA